MAIRQSLTSEPELLARLRAPILRLSPCPVCRYQRERATRLADLLVRALRDPQTMTIYQDAPGVCFHHLAQVVAVAEEPAQALTLIRIQRTRLALLQWELEEAQRKQSWSLRWEPKGTEQAAWRNAVTQYSGLLFE
jgi:hypothetical protein